MIYKGYRVNEPLKPADIFVCNCKYGHYNCKCDGNGGKRMNGFERFKASLEIMEFELKNDKYKELIVIKWVEELGQILQQYHDMANMNAGNVINKTEQGRDPYYGKKGPK